MGSTRWTAGLVLPLLASTLLAVAPPAASQVAAELAIADPENDVVAYPLGPNQPGGLPASDASDGLDFVGARLFDESGDSFLLQVRIKNMDAEGAVPSDGVWVWACFTWNGAVYAVAVKYLPALAGILFNRDLGLVDGTCKADADIKFAGSPTNIGNDVYLDLSASTLTIAIQRATLASISGQAAPQAGDTVGNLFVRVYDKPKSRLDWGPTGGPAAETMTLSVDTANLGDLALVGDSNISPSPCESRIDGAHYAIQAGGTRGVPVTLSNLGIATRLVQLSTLTVSGQDWKPRIMPQVDVPPTADAGNTTVTIIVSPTGALHTDCSILRVRAVDAADPATVAEATLIVLAVQPPDPEHHTLWMHANGFAGPGTCSGADTWLNVLEDDPNSQPAEIYMKDCRNPDLLIHPLSNGQGVSLFTQLDVNPNHDLVLNTSASGKDAVATLYFKTNSAPTESRITVTLCVLAGGNPTAPCGDVLGEAFTDTTVSGQPTEVVVTIPLAFTRDEVASGDPSRTVRSQDGLGANIRFAPLPADPNVDQAKAGGQLLLLTEGTHFDLPIYATVKTNAFEPGRDGGLFSLKALGVLPEYANPGLPRLFNFTALNEGAEPDAAVPSATFRGAPGWTVQFVPAGPYQLAPGERRNFQVAVTPPADAKESTRVILDLVLASQRDPTASSSLSFTVTATSVNLPTETIPLLDEGGGGGGFIPAPSALVLLGALGLGAMLLRRRGGWGGPGA